jgi:hypothetical protein
MARPTGTSRPLVPARNGVCTRHGAGEKLYPHPVHSATHRRGQRRVSGSVLWARDTIY